MRDCPTIASRVREGKQVPPRVPGNDAPKMNHFYALQGSKPDENDDDYGKFFYFFL